MQSQADFVSGRPRLATALPNTWGHLMAETSSNLSIRFEDRDTQLTADDSALQRRAERMTQMAQKYHASRKHHGNGSPGTLGGTDAATSIHAVDVVDAWGYYQSSQHAGHHPQRGGHSSSDDEGAYPRTPKGGAIGQGGKRSGGRGSSRRHTGDGGATNAIQHTPGSGASGVLRWRDAPPRQHSSELAAATGGRSRGLLTPPTIFDHNISISASAPAMLSGATPVATFTPRFGREVLPPPHMF